MDAFELLAAQLLRDQSQEQTNNPYTSGAAGIDSVLATLPRYHVKPWESLLAGALGGFASGALKGIGTASADQKTSGIAQKLAAALELSGSAQTDAFKDPELSKYGVINQIATIQEKRDSEKLRRQALTDALLKPPTMRTITQGLSEKQQEYDPLTRTWSDIGAGPRFQPKDDPNATTPKDVASIEDSMRKELKGGIPTDQFLKGETAFQNMLKAYSDKSGSSDLDLLYGGIQTREPGLAVRQDDQSLISTSLGLGGVFAEAAGYVQSGRKLTPSMRANIIKSAGNARDARIALIQQDFDTSKGIAERRKLNPENILPFNLPELSTRLMEKTFGGELWQDDSGNNFIINKDANGNPVSRTPL